MSIFQSNWVGGLRDSITNGEENTYTEELDLDNTTAGTMAGKGPQAIGTGGLGPLLRRDTGVPGP
jgi:hypothetical protein